MYYPKINNPLKPHGAISSSFPRPERKEHCDNGRHNLLHRPIVSLFLGVSLYPSISFLYVVFMYVYKNLMPSHPTSLCEKDQLFLSLLVCVVCIEAIISISFHTCHLGRLLVSLFQSPFLSQSSSFFVLCMFIEAQCHCYCVIPSLSLKKNMRFDHCHYHYCLGKT